ncbi:MAG: hypothetical protein MET45_30560 [Nostoc sp. LLA-1]|nr:hypothetical protein [Cyanocohniella sp. LLY]
MSDLLAAALSAKHTLREGYRITSKNSPDAADRGAVEPLVSKGLGRGVCSVLEW